MTDGKVGKGAGAVAMGANRTAEEEEEIAGATESNTREGIAGAIGSMKKGGKGGSRFDRSTALIPIVRTPMDLTRDDQLDHDFERNR